MKLQTLFVRYSGVAMAYEGVRAAAVLWGAEVRDSWGKDDPPRPVLLAEKALLGAVMIGAAPYLAPVHAVNDLCLAEVSARGWDAARFGMTRDRRHPIEFLWG